MWYTAEVRTSYSALSAYEQCPQKYKFQEIDRIRAPKSFEALFGTLIHESIQFMFERSPLYPTLDEVLAYFREHWPSKEALRAESDNDPRQHPLSDAEERLWLEEGVKILKRFYEKNAPWTFSVLDLETRFEVAIADPATGKTHILAGIMDRIDKLPDGYEIIDYKTSKRMPPQEKLEDDLQLSLYALGLRNRWPHITADEIRMSLYFVKHGEKLTTRATTEKLQRTEERLLAAIQEIEGRVHSGKDFPPNPSPLCDWCGYRPLCPAWKHLYAKTGSRGSQELPGADAIQAVLGEFFELKKAEAENKERITELQDELKAYMDREGLTRLFGDAGTVSKQITQRFSYDWEKVRSLLSPLGKWEEVLAADETKLKAILGTVPEATRREIERTRVVGKEYYTLRTQNKNDSASS